METESTVCYQTSTSKESQKRATTSPNRPSHPTVMPRCVQSAPAAPLTPAPHILQRRFDQRRESECAPCYLAGSRPWTRHMIAECRAFGGGGPLGQVGLTTTGYRRSLNCGGAGRSSLPLHLRALSLTRRPHQVPAHHLLTLNSQHSGCQRCSHLTAACKYGSDAPR